MAREPRQNDRVNASVTVRMDDATGMTRDISPSGVYFVIGEKLETGQTIRFSLEFTDPSGGMLHLNCVGRVVRVEDAAGKIGAAVAITESQLERRGAPSGISRRAEP